MNKCDKSNFDCLTKSVKLVHYITNIERNHLWGKKDKNISLRGFHLMTADDFLFLLCLLPQLQKIIQ